MDKHFHAAGSEVPFNMTFKVPVAMEEIQVPGLLGKVLTGPWTSRFYKGAASEIGHIEGLVMVKEVLDRLEVFQQEP